MYFVEPDQARARDWNEQTVEQFAEKLVQKPGSGMFSRLANNVKKVCKFSFVGLFPSNSLSFLYRRPFLRRICWSVNTSFRARSRETSLCWAFWSLDWTCKEEQETIRFLTFLSFTRRVQLDKLKFWILLCFGFCFVNRLFQVRIWLLTTDSILNLDATLKRHSEIALASIVWVKVTDERFFVLFLKKFRCRKARSRKARRSSAPIAGPRGSDQRSNRMERFVGVGHFRGSSSSSVSSRRFCSHSESDGRLYRASRRSQRRQSARTQSVSCQTRNGVRLFQIQERKRSEETNCLILFLMRVDAASCSGSSVSQTKWCCKKRKWGFVFWSCSCLLLWNDDWKVPRVRGAERGSNRDEEAKVSPRGSPRGGTKSQVKWMFCFRCVGLIFWVWLMADFPVEVDALPR